MQQHLPFTVLKLSFFINSINNFKIVATALTVYGIETIVMSKRVQGILNELQQHLPFTVLKLHNIFLLYESYKVATALTVYGIETISALRTRSIIMCCNSTYRLRY